MEGGIDLRKTAEVGPGKGGGDFPRTGEAASFNIRINCICDFSVSCMG